MERTCRSHNLRGELNFFPNWFQISFPRIVMRSNPLSFLMMGLFFQYRENGLWSRGWYSARSVDRLVPSSCTRLVDAGAWERKKNRKYQGLQALLPACCGQLTVNPQSFPIYTVCTVYIYTMRDSNRGGFLRLFGGGGGNENLFSWFP